ncbi:ribosome biogenesis protein Rrs1 [Schizosaccharomyces japonicus yFS275]|uniref:Ribosome biogenesis regulatory protein n=1 Tax=Schizosaccharomyces japonicus (strain yFS275 / FY16936) TaxID=402676 RepID=B6K0T0_SCHJY|nr:ribosome biogenesis protein Rrs1 [Schizosaccharomyces japonicus yFS275]EEB07551.1 ribosome biogenesis protein Rrs1 [Schizosaccharomyces japonicus yFS275]
MSVHVEKELPLELDLGNMCAFDIAPVSKGIKEEQLRALARDNAQVLINQMFSLPTESTKDGLLLLLPDGTTPLPRAKPLPKPKPETRWQKFARIKGIAPKKREGKLVYDEASGEWVPRWGYGGKNKALDNQWLVEEGEKEAHEKIQKLKKQGKKIKRSRRH